MKHQVTRLFAIILSLLTLCTVLPLYASCTSIVTAIPVDVFPLDGYDVVEVGYCEFVSATGSGSFNAYKRTHHYNSDNKLVFTVTLQCTFERTSSSKGYVCTNAHTSYTSYDSDFTVYSDSVSKSGNYGKCKTVIAMKFLTSRIPVKEINMTLTCRTDGTVY